MANLINLVKIICKIWHKKMASKFNKYWDECDYLLSFGSILHPRYKKGIIRFAYTSMYRTEFEEKIKEVEECFLELYGQYSAIYGDRKGKGPENYRPYLKQPPSSTVGKRKFDEFMLTLQSQGKEKTDLELYYEEPCFLHVANFDVLAWWKGNERK